MHTPSLFGPRPPVSTCQLAHVTGYLLMQDVHASMSTRAANAANHIALLYAEHSTPDEETVMSITIITIVAQPQQSSPNWQQRAESHTSTLVPNFYSDLRQVAKLE